MTTPTDPLDALVTPTRTVHLACDSHGVSIVRVDDLDNHDAPPQFRGPTLRDALSGRARAEAKSLGATWRDAARRDHAQPPPSGAEG